MDIIGPIIILLFITCSIWGPYVERMRGYTYSDKPSVYDEYDKEHREEYDAVRRALSGQGVIPPIKDVIVEVTDTVPDVIEDKVQDVVSLDDIEEEMAKIKNIAPNPRDTTWFVCDRKDLPAPSVAEQKIIGILEYLGVLWYREISFRGLQFTTYSHPRFDFYLPEYNLILEYDGVLSHSSAKSKAVDRAKDKFCKINSIRVKRLDRNHYHHLLYHIQQTIAVK